MGRTGSWIQQFTRRGALHPPGPPSHRQEVERRFWSQVATGITSEKAAAAVGVSQAIGARWFRQRGGMPLFMALPISARYLSFAEREEIGLLFAHGERSDGKWVDGWSPEQIANRIKLDFPNDETMRISHEAIYQALYIQGSGALKRELVAYVRTGRALRVPRARAQAKAWAHVNEEAMISNRPVEVEDRAVPGHWEGDLIIGLDRSAIGTLVARASRFTMLVHLPRERGYCLTPRVKNSRPLAGYGAVSMANALKKP